MKSDKLLIQLAIEDYKQYVKERRKTRDNVFFNLKSFLDKDLTKIK